MEEFDCRTRIVSGTGTVRRLENFRAKGLFLVTDPYFYENGTARRVAEAAKAERVEIFHEVKPDPRWSWQRRERPGFGPSIRI